MHRSTFIRNTLLGLAYLPLDSLSKKISEANELYDVVIIGAGLSGLTAARMLVKADKKVLVLEAQDRVGGRTWSQDIGQGNFIDIGGQWIGKGHQKMYQLAEEAGIKTFPTFAKGENILRNNGKNQRYKGDNPPLGLFSLLSMQKAMRKFDKRASLILPDTPWFSDKAVELDQQSVGSWIDRKISNTTARAFIKRVVEGEICLPVENVSMLQALSSAKATGSFQQAESVEDGALRDRIFGGAQSVCHFLHNQIKGSVKLNCPVTFVNQSDNHVEIGNMDFFVKTKKVIVTAPIAVVKQIKFTPALPVEKQTLISAMEMGVVIKCHAVYEKPFWRDSGLSGSSICLDEVVELSIDNSVAGCDKGIIASLIHAERAKSLLDFSAEERRNVILRSYTELFGREAMKPIMYHDYSFSNNPWIGGAYSGYFKKGIFSKYGEYISKPTGNVYWAGTETSHSFKGFMEGAVLSGERVAKEIVL